MTENKISILCSSSLNDEKLLKKYALKIIDFINEKISKSSVLTIGNLKNANLIKFLKDNMFDINIKMQHPNSLAPSNKKLISESDIVIFLNYNSSRGMNKFIEYAQNIENKEYYVLEIEEVPLH